MLKWLSKVSLRFKLMGGMSVMLVVSALAVISGLVQLKALDKQTAALANGYQESIGLEELQTVILQQKLAEKNYLLSGDEQYLDLYDNYEAQKHDVLSNLQGVIRKENQNDLGAVVMIEETYGKTFSNLITLYEDNSYEEAVALSLGDADKQIQQIRGMVNEVIQKSQMGVQQDLQAAQKRVESGMQVGLLGLVLTLVIGLLTGLFISGYVARMTGRMAQAAERIANVDLTNLAHFAHALAEGDLSAGYTVEAEELTYEVKDEIGRLAESFNQMVVQLQEAAQAFGHMSSEVGGVIDEVNRSAAEMDDDSQHLAAAALQTDNATEEVAATIQQIANGSQQQTTSINQTAGSVEQMSNIIASVANGAQEQARAIADASRLTAEISQHMENASQAATIGSNTVEETIQGMNMIKESVDLSTQSVNGMGQHSEEIGMIVSVIDDIASQTNLLALNAAIEAARAGEHGKGFAVVADEVRKLAERSAEATKEITELIKEIQRTVAEAVAAMNSSAQQVDSGVNNARKSGQALVEIMQTNQEVDTAVRQLSQAMDEASAVVEENTAATEEMAAFSDQVSQAVESISGISEQSGAAIEEVSSSTEEMSMQVKEVSAQSADLAAMASRMTVLASRFKTRNRQTQDIARQIRVFEHAHTKRVEKLKAILIGKADVKQYKPTTHIDCIMGQWYYSSGQRDFSGLASFAAVEDPHKRFHDVEHLALQALQKGEQERAQQLADELEKLSSEIVSSLHQLAEEIRSSGG